MSLQPQDNTTALLRRFGWGNDHIELVIRSKSPDLLRYIPRLTDYQTGSGATMVANQVDQLSVNPEATLAKLALPAGKYTMTYYIVHMVAENLRFQLSANAQSEYYLTSTSSFRESLQQRLDGLLGGDGYQHVVLVRKSGETLAEPVTLLASRLTSDRIILSFDKGLSDPNAIYDISELLIDPYEVSLDYSPLAAIEPPKQLRGPKLPQPLPVPAAIPVESTLYTLSSLPAAVTSVAEDRRWPTSARLEDWVHFGGLKYRFLAFIEAMRVWLATPAAGRSVTPVLLGPLEEFWFFVDYPRDGTLILPFSHLLVARWIGNDEPTGSLYGGWLKRASEFDAANPARLRNGLPEFVKEDPRSESMSVLMDMAGSFFDQFWAKSKALLDVYKTDHKTEINSTSGWAAWASRFRHHRTYWEHFRFSYPAYRSMASALAVPDWKTTRVGKVHSGHTPASSHTYGIVDETGQRINALSHYHRFWTKRLFPQAGEVRSGVSAADQLETALKTATPSAELPTPSYWARPDFVQKGFPNLRNWRRDHPLDWNPALFANRELPWLKTLGLNGEQTTHRDVFGYLLRPAEWDTSVAKTNPLSVRIIPLNKKTIVRASPSAKFNPFRHINLRPSFKGTRELIKLLTIRQLINRTELMSEIGPRLKGVKRVALALNANSPDGAGIVAAQYRMLIGVFRGVDPVIYRPGWSRVTLRQLVDELGNVRELSGLNREWGTVQGMYKPADQASVSFWKSDTTPGLNGLKPVVESGYKYAPILAWKSGSTSIKFDGQEAINPGIVKAAHQSNQLISTALNKVHTIFPDVVTNQDNRYTKGRLDGLTQVLPQYKASDTGQYEILAKLPIRFHATNANVKIGYKLVVYKNQVNAGSIVSQAEILFWPKKNGEPKPVEYALYEPVAPEDVEAFSRYWAEHDNSLGGAGAIPYEKNVAWTKVKDYKVNGVRYMAFRSSHGYTTPDLKYYLDPKTRVLVADTYVAELNQTLSLILPPLSAITLEGIQSGAFGVISNTLTANDTLYFSLEKTIGENIGTDTTVTIQKGATLSIQQKNQNLGLKGGLVTAVSGTRVRLAPGMALYMKGTYQQISDNDETILKNYGPIEDPFALLVDDLLVLHNSRTDEWTMSRINAFQLVEDQSVDLILSDSVPSSWAADEVVDVAVLRKKNDETCVFLKTNKPLSSTGYGFILPDRLHTRILDNIDPILNQLKAKLIREQDVETLTS